MASRPVFLPCFDGNSLVREKSFEFQWAPGFSLAQKQKNIRALHATARASGLKHILEISSKSEEKTGQRLSAFSLQITLSRSAYPLESVYQGSKVFEHSGGPFPDLWTQSPREAKRCVRAYQEENVICFELEDTQYPLEPRSAFYDWLYIRSLVDHAEWIDKNIDFEAFTDIEFNPMTQMNCQARAFATFRSLMAWSIDRSELRRAAADFDYFASLLSTSSAASPKTQDLPLFDCREEHSFA